MGTEVNAAISAALPLIESLFALGLPGIILMLAAIPALVIVVVFVLDHRHGKRIGMVLEAYREDTQESLRVISEKFDVSLSCGGDGRLLRLRYSPTGTACCQPFP